MLYIYMLGYDVDFGHMEAVSLISAPKYPEKQVNYFTLMYLFIMISYCVVCLILVNCRSVHLHVHLAEKIYGLNQRNSKLS